MVVLFVASVLYHLPPLINFRGVHSDAALVGLQARHILNGEWAWHLWGVGYESSLEPLLVAGAFALTGPNALTLMIVPFIGYLLVVFFAFSTLRRHFTDLAAFLLSLPLVFTPEAINRVALYLPRQWSITLVFFAVWLVSGA